MQGRRRTPRRHQVPDRLSSVDRREGRAGLGGRETQVQVRGLRVGVPVRPQDEAVPFTMAREGGFEAGFHEEELEDLGEYAAAEALAYPNLARIIAWSFSNGSSPTT